MTHKATGLHCALDWLGRTVVALLATLGILYTSAFMFGYPNLPDPDRHHNGCQR